ncbi:cupin domain-containing protein [Oceanispirochaeta sp.]|jgi:mannose-6-phosphate isomerase-like protein (cupin superfamily)|uniref:cupin domain-containing protein n=1 Tax=Oceanispirochaeta sp. TaxID=2035350 RepID=UPI00262D3ABA|nr:cupin domain-containing protein [Oceanispirochaeta sp.]MDA3957280.1 cupin domain-containing protein [Oceanispirochaeta sp.]
MLEKQLSPLIDEEGKKGLMTIFFDRSKETNDKVQFGHIVFNPGDRTPKEGYGVHAQDEYSYIIKGTAVCVINDIEYRSGPGSAMFIPAGEKHYSFNDGEEPCEIIWMLIDK